MTYRLQIGEVMMVKRIFKWRARQLLLSLPHTLRFIDGGAAIGCYEVKDGRRAVASATWLNRAGIRCFVEGPAFADLEMVRAAWESDQRQMDGCSPELIRLVFALVAYGWRERFRKEVQRQFYLRQEVEQLRRPLRIELEAFL